MTNGAAATELQRTFFLYVLTSELPVIDSTTSPFLREQQLAELLQRRIDERRLQLPLLPRVVTDVLRLTGDEGADVRQLATLIESDQSLAGHVLRTAQAAAFGGIEINSLRAALQRLGMRNIATIAIAAALGPKLFVVPGCEALVQRLWRESLGAALWAREIAASQRLDAEQAFLCGLMHRVGEPVILHEVMEASLRLDFAPDQVLLCRLLDRFGALVGVELAGHWRLPDVVIEVIAALDGAALRSPIADCVASAAALAALEPDAPWPETLDGVDTDALQKLQRRRESIEAMVAALG